MRAPCVLLVLAHDDARELMASALREAGFEVRAAVDAPTALEILYRSPPVALLVADFPGHQLAVTRLRREPSLAKVPLLAVCQGASAAPDEAVAFIRTPAGTRDLLEWTYLLTGTDPEAMEHRSVLRLATG